MEVFRQTIRVGRDNFYGSGAVKFEYFARKVWRDSMLVEKHHDVGAGPLGLPRLNDDLRLFTRDAFHLHQTGWVFIQDFESFFTEVSNDAPCCFFADALDQAGGKVADHCWFGCRSHR